MQQPTYQQYQQPIYRQPYPQPKLLPERFMWLSAIAFVGTILCFVLAYLDYNNFMNALSTGITGLSWSTGYLGDMFHMIFYGLLCWLASTGFIIWHVIYSHWKRSSFIAGI